MNLTIITPVYNDWDSFRILIREIDRVCANMGMQIHVLAIDDGSFMAPDAQQLSFGVLGVVRKVEIIKLVCNLGHQRAIAVGLAVAMSHAVADAILVMDSDGEDRPHDIPSLVRASCQHPGAIICARRMNRSEGLGFRICYRLYKSVFRLFTGAVIDFGNFCLIPVGTLRLLTYNSNIWNNLAASIVRSRIPLHRVNTARGVRYAGRSHMNIVALITHGLSAVSAYSDICLVRLLITLLGLAFVIVLGLIGLFVIRFATEAAIPGWTSTVFGLLCAILLQALMIAGMAVFMLLSSRSYAQIVPAIDSVRYIANRDMLRLEQQNGQANWTRTASVIPATS